MSVVAVENSLLVSRFFSQAHRIQEFQTYDLSAILGLEAAGLLLHHFGCKMFFVTFCSFLIFVMPCQFNVCSLC